VVGEAVMIWVFLIAAVLACPFVILWLWGACEALGAVISDAIEEALSRWDR